MKNQARRTSWQVKGTASLFVLFLAFLGVELVASALLVHVYGWWTLTNRRSPNSVYDEELGWRCPTGRHTNHYGEGRHRTCNRRGIRDAREFSPRVPTGRFRILAIGDSFTQGAGVDDSDSFPAQLERIEPRFQVVNLGFGGYGIDQMNLWYRREARRLDHQMVLMTFIRDDIDRARKPAFLVQSPKPRFLVENSQLVLTNMPVPTWGRASSTGFWEEFPRRTSAYQVLVERWDNFAVRRHLDTWQLAGLIFSDVKSLAEANDRAFVLVYIADLLDIESGGTAGFPPRAAHHTAKWAKHTGSAFIDTTDALAAAREAGARVYLKRQPAGHLTEFGNEVIARRLVRAIRRGDRFKRWLSESSDRAPRAGGLQIHRPRASSNHE